MQYKVAGESRVYSKEYADAQAHLQGLRPGTRYLFRVRGNYGASSGPYSRVGQFKLPIDASMASARIAMPVSNPLVRSAVDPDNEVVLLYFPYDTEVQVMIEVKDGFGELIQASNTYTVYPRSALTLSSKAWGKGAFLIRVSDNEGFADDIWVDL